MRCGIPWCHTEQSDRPEPGAPGRLSLRPVWHIRGMGSMECSGGQSGITERWCGYSHRGRLSPKPAIRRRIASTGREAASVDRTNPFPRIPPGSVYVLWRTDTPGASEGIWRPSDQAMCLGDGDHVSYLPAMPVFDGHCDSGQGQVSQVETLVSTFDLSASLRGPLRDPHSPPSYGS